MQGAGFVKCWGRAWDYLSSRFHLPPRPRPAASAGRARRDPEHAPTAPPAPAPRSRGACADRGGRGPSRDGSCGSRIPAPAVGIRYPSGACCAARGRAGLRATWASDPSLTASPRLQPVRPRAQVPRGAGRGKPGRSSPGPRPGAAFRQRGGRWRCFRDSARRPRRRRRRTRAAGSGGAAPGPGAHRPALSGGGGAGTQGPGGRRPTRSPAERPFRAGTPAARSLARSSPATSRGSAAPSRPGPPAPPPPGRRAAPKCAIGRARRRRLLPPSRSHGDPRQPMQWTLGPCGTPGAATAPAPLHYKYFSKMRRSSLRAPRPPAASAPRS